MTASIEMKCSGSSDEVLVSSSSPATTTDNNIIGEPSVQDQEEDSKRKVCFSTIEIRDYPMIVGDNPAVSSGVPLTIGWVHDGVYETTVEEYENLRPNAPRSMVELKMPKRVRESLLRRLHFSTQDMMDGTKMANIARGRRNRTNELKQLWPLMEFAEKARRATLNATIRRSTKQKERAYLESFLNAEKSLKLQGRPSSCPTVMTAPLDRSVSSLIL